MSSIDTNDIKILVHSSLQILMKSCCHCLKDNPIISVILLALLSFYIFFPTLFYLSPLVICTAILLQGKFHFLHQNISTNVSGDDSDKAAKETQVSAAQNKKIRPTIQAAMSRRTFKKRTPEELGTILLADLQVDAILRGLSDAVKIDAESEKGDAEKDVIHKVVAEKPSDGVKIVAEIHKEDKSESKLVVEKEQSKAGVDLGSSETEWDVRIENLIAKRRARKMFNMTPQMNDFQGHVVSPIKAERSSKDTEGGGQPGSAPSVVLPTNPFDLPYDPSEEKPILTGDGFAEEFSSTTHPKDLHYCRHESFTYGPSFFTQHFEDPPYRRQSDIEPELSVKSSHEARLKNTQHNPREEANISVAYLPAIQEDNGENADTILLESVDSTKEQEETQKNISPKESNESVGEETEMNPDLNKDGNDEASSSSSFEANDDIASSLADVAFAVKNETFRNSVKKVLGVIQKKRGTPPIPPSVTDSCEDSSIYTRPGLHLSHSVASDLQVEVSDGPNSPTDVETLVFGKEEIDQNGHDSEQKLKSSHDNEEGMVGSASTSTEQNIGTYINSPSSNDTPHGDSQSSASSPSASSNRGSSSGSSSSPKSVLPETTVAVPE